MLPIFTSPDTAMAFLVDLYHRGELVTLLHIDSTSQLFSLISMIRERQGCLVIVDAPNPDNIKHGDELVYWSGEEFSNILTDIVKLAKKHDCSKAIDVLDRYLNSKIKNTTYPVNL